MMTGVIILLGILFGLAIAGSCAFTITMCSVSKSNDMGNSKGEFKSFVVGPLRILERKNGVNPKRYK